MAVTGLIRWTGRCPLVGRSGEKAVTFTSGGWLDGSSPGEIYG